MRSVRRLSQLLETKLLMRKASTQQRLVVVHMAPQGVPIQATEGEATTQTEASLDSPESPQHTACASPPGTPKSVGITSQDTASRGPPSPSCPQECMAQPSGDTRFSVTDAAELLAHTAPLVGDEWESDDGLESE